MSEADADRILAGLDHVRAADKQLGISEEVQKIAADNVPRKNMFSPGARSPDDLLADYAENELRFKDLTLQEYRMKGGRTESVNEQEWAYEREVRREQLTRIAFDRYKEKALLDVVSGKVPQLYSPDEEANYWDATGKAVWRGGYKTLGSIARRLNTLQSYVTGDKSRAMEAFELGRKSYFAANPDRSELKAERWWENLTSGKKFANTVFSNTPYMLFTLGSMIATGGGAAGIAAAGGIAYLVEGQEAYDRAIEAGAGTQTAEWSANIVGSINAVIELAQISRLLKLNKAGVRLLAGRTHKALMKKLASARAGKVLQYATRRNLATMGRESLEEMLQGWVGDQAAKHLYGQDVPWGEYINSRLNEAVSAAGATLLFGVPNFVAGSQGIKFTKQEISDIYKGIDIDFVTKQLTENYVISAKKARQIATSGLTELESIRQVYEGEMTPQEEEDAFNNEIIPSLLNEYEAKEVIKEKLDEAIDKIPETERVEVENKQSKTMLAQHLKISDSASTALIENPKTRAQTLLLRDALENDDVDEVNRLSSALRAHLSNTAAPVKKTDIQLPSEQQKRRTRLLKTKSDLIARKWTSTESGERDLSRIIQDALKTNPQTAAEVSRALAEQVRAIEPSAGQTLLNLVSNPEFLRDVTQSLEISETVWPSTLDEAIDQNVPEVAGPPARKQYEGLALEWYNKGRESAFKRNQKVNYSDAAKDKSPEYLEAFEQGYKDREAELLEERKKPEALTSETSGTLTTFRVGDSRGFAGTHYGTGMTATTFDKKGVKLTKKTFPLSGPGVVTFSSSVLGEVGNSDAPGLANATAEGFVKVPQEVLDIIGDRGYETENFIEAHDLIGALSLKLQGVDVAHFVGSKGTHTVDLSQHTVEELKQKLETSNVLSTSKTSGEIFDLNRTIDPPQAVTSGLHKINLSKSTPIKLIGNKAHILSDPDNARVFTRALFGKGQIIDAFSGSGVLANYIQKRFGVDSKKSVIRNDLSDTRYNAQRLISTVPNTVKKQIAAVKKRVLEIDNDNTISRTKRNQKISRYLESMYKKSSNVGAYIVAQSLSSYGAALEISTTLKLNTRQNGSIAGMARLRSNELEESVDDMHETMNRQSTVVSRQDGWTIVESASTGDLVLIDPEYFDTKALGYTPAGQQDKSLEGAIERVKNEITRASKAGADIIYMNSWNQKLANELEKIGFVTKKVERNVGSNKVSEILAYNILDDSIEMTLAQTTVSRTSYSTAETIEATGFKLLDMSGTLSQGSVAEKLVFRDTANSPVYVNLALSVSKGFEVINNKLISEGNITKESPAEFGGFMLGTTGDVSGFYFLKHHLGAQKEMIFLSAADAWLGSKQELRLLSDMLSHKEAMVTYAQMLVDNVVHEIAHNNASHSDEASYQQTLAAFDAATTVEQANAVALIVDSLQGQTYDLINNTFSNSEAWAGGLNAYWQAVRRNAIETAKTGEVESVGEHGTSTGLQPQGSPSSVDRATTEAISEQQRKDFGDTLKNPENVDPGSLPPKGPPSDYNNTLGKNARNREESGRKYRFGLMSHTIFDLVDNIGHIEQTLGLPGLYNLSVMAERGFMHSRAYQKNTYERINKAAGQDARLLPLDQQLLIANILNSGTVDFPDTMSPAAIAVAKELRKMDNEEGGGKFKEKHNRLLHYAQTGNVMGLTGDRLATLENYDHLRSLKGEELSNELQRLSKASETDFLVVTNYSKRMAKRFIGNIVGENMFAGAYMPPLEPGRSALQSRVKEEGPPAEDFVSEILHHYVLQDRYYEMSQPINELWKQASPHLQPGSMNTLKKALQRLVGVYDSPLSSTLLEVQKSMSNLFKVPASTGKLQLKQFVQRLFGRTNMPIAQAMSLYTANKAAFEKKWGSDMTEYMEKRIIMERPLYKELYASFTATPWGDLTNAGKVIRTVGNNPVINYMNSLFADYMADAHIWLDGKNRYSTMDSWLTTATDVLKKKRLPWAQAKRKLGFSKLMPWEQNYLEELYTQGKVDDVILETARLQTEHNQFKYIKPLRDFFSNTTIGMPTMQYATWWRNYVKLWYTQLYNLKNGDRYMKAESVKSLANHLALSVVGGTVFSAIVGQLKGGRDLPERLVNTAAAQLDPFSYGGVGGVNTLFTPVSIISKWSAGEMPSQIWAAARSFTKGVEHAGWLIGRSIQYGFDRDEVTLDKLKIEARDVANVGEEYLNYYYWGYRRATAILDSWGDKRRAKYLRVAGNELFGIDYKPKIQERSALLRIQNALFVTNPPTSTGDLHGAVKSVALESTTDDYVDNNMKLLVKNGTTLRDALRVLDKWGREKVERKYKRGRRTITRMKPRFERETLNQKKRLLRRRWSNYNREH